MTENYIRDYMRLAYQEAVNVQRHQLYFLD